MFRTTWENKKFLMKFSCHSRQVLIATVFIDCYPAEQYSTCRVAMDKVSGDLCSVISLAAGLLGDLRQVTSPLHAPVSNLQNGDSDTDCLHRALCKLLLKSTTHELYATVTETLWL